MIVGSTTPSGAGIALSHEGVKQSGFGREGGVAGLESYTVGTGVYVLA